MNFIFHFNFICIILLQAEGAGLQGSFIVFCVLLLLALTIGGLSYLQLSKKFLSQKVQLNQLKNLLKRRKRSQDKLKKVRKSLKKSKHLRTIIKGALQSSRSAIYSIDFNSPEIKFSKSIEAVFGLSMAEIEEIGINKNPDYQSFIHPDDREKQQAALEQAIAEGALLEIEYRLVLPNGEIWIRASGLIHYKDGKPDKMDGIIQNINDYHRISDQLNQSESRMRAAIKAGDISVFVQNQDLKYIWIQTPIQLGENVSFIGKGDIDLGYPREEIEISIRFKNKVLQTGVAGVKEVWLTNPVTKKLTCMKVYAEPFEFPDGSKGLIGSAYDITELKMSQKELAETATSLMEEKKKADEATKNLRGELEKRSADLEEARNIQTALVPRILPQIDWLESALYMKPCLAVGGDYLDIRQEINTESEAGTEKVSLLIGDATGYGIRATIVTTSIKAYYNTSKAEFLPSGFLSLTDENLKTLQMKNMFMALTAVLLEKNQITFSMAGMPPLFIARAATREVELYHQKRIFLGTGLGNRAEDITIPLLTGDVILLLTDGILEVMAEKQPEAAIENIKQVLVDNLHLGVDSIKEKYVNLAEEWTIGKERIAKDDITLAILKIK